MGKELLVSANFYLQFYDWAPDELDMVGGYIYLLSDEMKTGGDTEAAEKLLDAFSQMYMAAAEAYGSRN